MKKISVILIGALFSFSVLYAQAPPQAFSFKATISGNHGQPLVNKDINLRISILQNSTTGPVVYSEVFNTTTNSASQVDIQIGTGTPVTGTFSAIPWSTDVFFLKIEVDTKLNGNYQMLSTTQLLSVPYALYAGEAGIALNEYDPLFSASPAYGINSGDISNWNTSYDWGNHAAEGYLKNFTEADPIFEISPAKDISSQNISNWQTAFGWGNHAAEGYLKSFTEVDPIFGVSPAKNITTVDIENWNNAATKSEVELLKSQLEALERTNLTLWNKLGSINEAVNSTVGPKGTIVGSVNFNNTVKFDKGITPNTGGAGSGVDFPTTVVNPERGCVEMWVKFYYLPQAYYYGVYGFINAIHWTPNVMSFAYHNYGFLRFELQFNGTLRSVDFTGFTPSLNMPIHIACVWDRTGIDGTPEYMRIYVNGVKMAVNNTNRDWGNNNTSGNFRVAAPWDSSFSTDRYSVDNIKVWNYAKTTFELNKE